MRLTLRTLLAYLDDVLEPHETREIGEKIAESEFASTLIKRIREVLRQRRISAPELAGPGSGPDPNVVAEYIDNVLPAANVSDFERLCLESNMHLAEVAASHQILTLVLGEPVEVSEETRARMHALGSVGPFRLSDVNPNVSATPPTTPKPTTPEKKPSSSAAVTTSAGDAMPMTSESFEHGLPEYLKRGRHRSRTWTIVLIVMITLGWLALVAFDPAMSFSPFSDQSLTETEPVDESISDDAADAAVSPAGDALAKPSAEGPSVAAATTDVKPTPDSRAEVSINPPPPDELLPPPADGEGSAEGTTDRTMAARTGEPMPPVAAPPMPEPTEPEPEPAPAAPVPPKLSEAEVMYESTDGVVLHRTGDEAPWLVLPRRSMIHVGDALAVPVPFSGHLRVGESDATLRLDGGSRVQRVPTPVEDVPAFVVDRGRLVFIRADGVEAPTSFHVTVAGQGFRLELLEPGTICGVEVRLAEPEGPMVPARGLPRMRSLVVASGAVQVAMGDAEPQEIRPEDGRVQLARGPGQLETVSRDTLPAWVSLDGEPMTMSARTLSIQFEKEFLPDQSVARSIPAIVRHRRAQMSEFAAQTLALTENVEELVHALKAEHEEARLAAIGGLRKWLGKAGSDPQRLRDEIDRSFRSETAEIVTRLLWGYGAEDAKTAAVSQQLLEWMAHDEVAVRELAFYHVARLTGRRFDYRPILSPSQRQAALMRWSDYVGRNGGTLIAP